MENLIQRYLNTFRDEKGQPTLTSVAYANDLSRWQRFLRRHLGREPQPGDLTAEHVRAFLESEAAEGVALTTLRRRVSVLRGLWRFAGEQGIELPPLPRPRELLAPYLSRQAQDSSQSPQVLQAEHLARLRIVLQHRRLPLILRDWALLCLLLETGLPVRRLTALNLQHVDWENRQLLIPEFPKEIWIPLQQAYEPLLDYVERGRPELVSQQSETALFISQGGRRMSRQSLWQLLRHWGEEAQLPFRLTPRLLRDTAALRMLQRGLQTQKAGEWLGFTNPLSMQAMVNRLKAVGGHVDMLYPLGGKWAA